MITYDWQIVSLDCYKSINGLQNAVYNIHWYYNGTDDVSGVSKSISGITPINEPDSNNFIPFENLDKSTISSWLESNLDITSLRNKIEEDINNEINSNTINIQFTGN